MLSTPGGSPIRTASSPSANGGDRGVAGRLSNDGITGRQGRGDLPCQHQQREIPGHDLTDDADRGMVWKLALQKLRPAGVVVEVARYPAARTISQAFRIGLPLSSVSSTASNRAWLLYLPRQA